MCIHIYVLTCTHTSTNTCTYTFVPSLRMLHKHGLTDTQSDRCRQIGAHIRVESCASYHNWQAIRRFRQVQKWLDICLQLVRQPAFGNSLSSPRPVMAGTSLTLLCPLHPFSSALGTPGLFNARQNAGSAKCQPCKALYEKELAPFVAFCLLPVTWLRIGVGRRRGHHAVQFSLVHADPPARTQIFVAVWKVIRVSVFAD